MLLHKRLVESTNRGFGSVGDEKAPPGQVGVIEDRLIEVLEDCITRPGASNRSVNLKPFREWLRTYGRSISWAPANLELCLIDDAVCEVTIHIVCCTLKRMAPRYEWSFNWLLQQGCPREAIPEGNDYLGH